MFFHLVSGAIVVLVLLALYSPHYAASLLVSDFQTSLAGSQQIINVYAQQAQISAAQTLFNSTIPFVGIFKITFEIIIGAFAIYVLFAFVRYMSKSFFICNRAKNPYIQNTLVKGTKCKAAQMSFIDTVNTVKLRA